MVLKNQHISLKGIEKIIAIKGPHNWGISPKLKLVLPLIIPLVVPIYFLSHVLHPSWF